MGRGEREETLGEREGNGEGGRENRRDGELKERGGEIEGLKREGGREREEERGRKREGRMGVKRERRRREE